MSLGAESATSSRIFTRAFSRDIAGEGGSSSTMNQTSEEHEHNRKNFEHLVATLGTAVYDDADDQNDDDDDDLNGVRFSRDGSVSTYYSYPQTPGTAPLLTTTLGTPLLRAQNRLWSHDSHENDETTTRVVRKVRTRSVPNLGSAANTRVKGKVRREHEGGEDDEEGRLRSIGTREWKPADLDPFELKEQNLEVEVVDGADVDMEEEGDRRMSVMKSMMRDSEKVEVCSKESGAGDEQGRGMHKLRPSRGSSRVLGRFRLGRRRSAQAHK